MNTISATKNRANKSYDIEAKEIGKVNIKSSLGAKYLHLLFNNQDAVYTPVILRNMITNKIDLSLANQVRLDFQNREEFYIYTALNSFIPATDIQAITEIRRELSKVREDLVEAKENNDLGRVDFLETEEEGLEKYLKECLNKNGAIKNLNNNSRKDIRSISSAINCVLREIAMQSEELAFFIDQVIIRNSNQVRVETDRYTHKITKSNNLHNPIDLSGEIIKDSGQKHTFLNMLKEIDSPISDTLIF